MYQQHFSGSPGFIAGLLKQLLELEREYLHSDNRNRLNEIQQSIRMMQLLLQEIGEENPDPGDECLAC